jgi:hypothetical protein
MIKNWKLFKESVDTESKIREICKEYDIENYTINDDLSIDVDDDVDLSSKNLTEIPLKFNKLDKIPLKFNRVRDSFICSENKLTSLIGCPEYVGYNFSCYTNKLKSLEGLPKYIGGYIEFDFNEIWSFKGIPDNFRGNLYCFGNPIDEIWKLFKSSKDIEFFNDCHIIREPETPDGKPIVVLERLNFFLETIGKPTVEKVNGYINI